MWHYLPDTAIVANIEFDHADIYRDAIAYNFAFARFINLIPGNGVLVAGWDSATVRELAAKSFAPVESFAYPAERAAVSGQHPRWRAQDVSFGPHETTFTVIHDGAEWGPARSPLAGAFSVRNILAVIAAAESVGADRERVREGLRTYKSVKRRMEVRGEARGVTVIDDFAHHPTAIRETIAAARQKYAGRRLVAVYEPRSYTAQLREFEDAYEAAFAAADDVILAGLFRPERYASNAMDPAALVERWRAAGKAASYIPAVPDIVRALERTLRSGDVVLIMSNGGFGGLHEKLLSALSESHG
jgi:UDP-N-acetylmuramate: L-alanyl-gamma-D-glutamyl-meso-diaminopimelate ligase